MTIYRTSKRALNCNKALCFCLTLSALFSVLLGTPKAWALDINTDTTLDNSLNEPAVITGNCTITLNGVSFTSTNGSAIVVQPGVQATFLLVGDNMLQGGTRACGIEVSPTASIVINGSGTLEATGGAGATQDERGGGAGIGGIGGMHISDGANAGKVTILGGTVIAKGGAGTVVNGSGAGIGGGGGATIGKGGAGGIVEISGGTVTATGVGHESGGKSSAGIGGGGAAAAGGGGAGGTVTISGGIVVATGGGNDYGSIAGKDIGAGGNGTAGTTTITGGSIQVTTVDTPTNGTDAVSNTVPTAYAGNAGKTISFKVSVAQPYQYTFTVPKDGNAYLWLPAAISPPTADAVNAPAPTLTVFPKYENSKCVVDLSITPGLTWERLDPGNSTWTSGTGTTDDNGNNGFATAGVYSYRTKEGDDNLSIWSNTASVTLVPPNISGPTDLTLQYGYDATSTGVFTFTGTPAPTVTNNAGDAKIAWNGTDNKWEIAAGLGVGEYSATLTAVNGIGSGKTHVFKLKVEGTAPKFTQSRDVFPDASVDVDYGTETFTFEATGNPTPKLSMSDPVDAHGLIIDFNETTGVLKIEGTPTSPGEVSAQITASNEVGNAAVCTWKLQVKGTAPSISGPTSLTLTSGYAATSTGQYTIGGAPVPTVTKTFGHDDITWDDAEKRLKITEGLPVGTYEVKLTAENQEGSKTHTFTLTVKTPVLPSDPTEPTEPTTPPANTGDILKDTAETFNNGNQAANVSVEFPGTTITNPAAVAAQLGGQKPVIVGNASVSNITLSPVSGTSAGSTEGLSDFGKGWGAKIEVQLKVTPKDGEILLLPVALTFALSEADLAMEGLTTDQVVADVSALLAKAIFAKFPAEGDDKDSMQNLTDLIASVITVTKDADGGISIHLPFLLANGKGEPKLVTDGNKTHLVIFDGLRNGWLRDPMYIFRKPAAFAVAGLVASPSSPKVGEKVTLTAMFSAAADEATISVAPPGGAAQGLTTNLASDKLSASATFTPDTAGSYTVKATARADMSTDELEVNVTVTEGVNDGRSGVGCDAGLGFGLLLGGAVLSLATRRRR